MLGYRILPKTVYRARSWFRILIATYPLIPEYWLARLKGNKQ